MHFRSTLLKVFKVSFGQLFFLFLLSNFSVDPLKFALKLQQILVFNRCQFLQLIKQISIVLYLLLQDQKAYLLSQTESSRVLAGFSCVFSDIFGTIRSQFFAYVDILYLFECRIFCDKYCILAFLDPILLLLRVRKVKEKLASALYLFVFRFFLARRSSLTFGTINMQRMSIALCHDIFGHIFIFGSVQTQLIFQTFDEAIFLNKCNLQLLDSDIQLRIFLLEQCYHFGCLGKSLVFELILIDYIFDSQVLVEIVASLGSNSEFRQFLSRPSITFSMLRQELTLSCLSISSCFEVKNLFYTRTPLLSSSFAGYSLKSTCWKVFGWIKLCSLVFAFICSLKLQFTEYFTSNKMIIELQANPYLPQLLIPNIQNGIKFNWANMRILTKLGRFGFVGTKLFPSAKAKGINQGSLRDKKQPTSDINNKIDVREETSNKTNSMWKQPITKVTPQMQIERQGQTQLVTKQKQQYSEPKKPQSSQVDRDFTNFQTKQETKEVNQRLKLLLMQRQEIFEKTELLPNYLNRISSLLTPQSFSFNQKQLNDINHNLNNFSLELGSSPLQHLSILKYRYRCRMLQPKFSQAGNHRFIHKATVVCQMLIHKQQLQLNQVIFAMEALLRMGALNVILFVNFTKYMKSVFKEEKKAAKITIQHIVTILNFGIMKRNEITIQNILYGQVLNFLLKNMGLLLKEKHIWMKVEVLNLFLIIDIKQFYIIDRKSKQIQTKKLFREIIQKFQKSNFCGQVIQNESQKAGSHNQEINWKCVLSIVQAINFSLQNRLEQLKYSQQFDSFIKRSVDSIFLNFDNGGQQLKIVKMEQLSYQEKNAIIRILFNVKALEFWLFCPQSSQRVIKILQAMKIKSEESFTPIVDLIYHLNYHSSKLALDKVSKLSEKLYEHYKTSIDLLAMFVALKQNSQKSSRIVNEPGSLYLKYYEKSFKDKLILYLIQKYYNEQVDKNFQKEFQKNVEQQLNNGSLITFYYEAIQYLRNYAIIGNSFCYFWSKINANNLFFQKMKKETNFMKQQYVQLLEILLFDKLNQRQLSPELNQIVQYLLKDANLKKIFLNRTFPPTYSYFYPYNKKVNLFTNFTEFTTKFKSLIEYYNEERYSYYLWDLLVKHIVRLPQKMRKEAYPLIKSVFFNAFQKDNLRKVVMLTVFTNYICSKTIIASKKTLSYELNCCVNQLIKAQEVIEYHYRCYLQIVVNALSFGILEQRTFDLLVKHAYQKSPNIKQTTTILLLYGATISKIDGMNNIKTKIKISSQESYLRMLANNKCIEEQTSVTIEDLQKGEEKQNTKRWLTIHISAKVIAIYLRFGIKQILFVEQIVLRYVKQCVELAQWQLIVYSFSPIMFTQPNKQQKQFAQRLLVILREKLLFFREKQLLTQAQYDEFSSKLL